MPLPIGEEPPFSIASDFFITEGRRLRVEAAAALVSLRLATVDGLLPESKSFAEVFPPPPPSIIADVGLFGVLNIALASVASSPIVGLLPKIDDWR